MNNNGNDQDEGNGRHKFSSNGQFSTNGNSSLLLPSDYRDRAKEIMERQSLRLNLRSASPEVLKLHAMRERKERMPRPSFGFGRWLWKKLKEEWASIYDGTSTPKAKAHPFYWLHPDPPHPEIDPGLVAELARQYSLKPRTSFWHNTDSPAWCEQAAYNDILCARKEPPKFREVCHLLKLAWRTFRE